MLSITMYCTTHQLSSSSNSSSVCCNLITVAFSSALSAAMVASFLASTPCNLMCTTSNSEECWAFNSRSCSQNLSTYIRQPDAIAMTQRRMFDVHPDEGMLSMSHSATPTSYLV